MANGVAGGTKEEDKVPIPGTASGPWESGGKLPEYDTPIGADPNFYKREQLLAQYPRDKGRFDWLDAKLMQAWGGEQAALEKGLNAASVSEAAQNQGLSQASSLGAATRGGKDPLAAYQGQRAQGEQAGQAISQTGQGRADEDTTKLAMMQDLAKRRNQYILGTQDLFNTSLGMQSSQAVANLANQYNENLAGIARGQQQMGLGFTGASAGAGVLGSLGGLIGQTGKPPQPGQPGWGSDERLKENIQKEEPVDKFKPIKELGHALADIETESDIEYFEPGMNFENPEQKYLNAVIGSGVELKKGIRSEKPGAEAFDGPYSPAAYGAAGINLNPGILRELNSGRMDERQALYIAAKNEEVKGNYTGAAKIRSVARRTPGRIKGSFLKGEFNPGKLEDADKAQLKQERSANAAGMAPIYQRGQISGYQPGKGSVWKNTERLGIPKQMLKPYRKPATTFEGGPPQEVSPGGSLRSFGSPKSQTYTPPDVITGSPQHGRGFGTDKAYSNPLDDKVLEDMGDIEGYSYEYKDEARDLMEDAPKGRVHGVMAQQVEESNPELVGEANGFKVIKGDQGFGKMLANAGAVSRKALEVSDKVRRLEQMLGIV